MCVLLIDGEYYRKLYSIERLQEIIERFIGIVNYPKSIVYYSCNSDNFRQKLSSVKNLKINDKGHISTQNGKKVQKGVDGYIVKDLILFAQDPNIRNIYLIAGDGDLIAGIEYAKENGKNLKMISCKENTSQKIIEMVEVFNFENYIKNIVVDTPSLSNNILNLKKMWLELKDDEGWLSSTTIGQKNKEYNFIYPKRRLKRLLSQLEKDKVISQVKEMVGPGKKIKFLKI